MDDVRNKYGNAPHHRWDLQCWDRLRVVSAEDDIVEELSLRFGDFHENIQSRLQGDDLAAELTIPSNMENEYV